MNIDFIVKSLQVSEPSRYKQPKRKKAPEGTVLNCGHTSRPKRSPRGYRTTLDLRHQYSLAGALIEGLDQSLAVDGQAARFPVLLGLLGKAISTFSCAEKC
jgi:hypothetical protein